jgi:hypothetical protein
MGASVDVTKDLDRPREAGRKDDAQGMHTDSCCVKVPCEGKGGRVTRASIGARWLGGTTLTLSNAAARTGVTLDSCE